MSITQTQIDALNQAIADGVRQVTLPGGQVTILNTGDSLIRARDDLQRQLRAQEAKAAGVRPGRQSLLYYAGRGHE
jgi:hypothetical protein